MIKLKCIKEFYMANGSKAPFTLGKYYESRGVIGGTKDCHLLTNDVGEDHYMPLSMDYEPPEFDGSLHFEVVETTRVALVPN